MERARYDKDTKETIIELFKENPKTKIAELASQFNLPYATVYSWVSKYSTATNSSPKRKQKEEKNKNKEVAPIPTASTPIVISERENYPNYLTRERNERLSEQLSDTLSQLDAVKKELELAQQQICATQEQLNETNSKLITSKEETKTLRQSMKILFSAGDI